MKKFIIILITLTLSLLSISGVYGVTISQAGTIVDPRGWMFSKSTPFGIYYGFGANWTQYPWTTEYPPNSEIYYFDFLTKTNTLIKSQITQPSINLPSATNPIIIWSDVLYSAIIGDKIFLTNFYYDYPVHSPCKECDTNGIYVLDTKTNSFYLYDRTPFDFFSDNALSPMTAVGNYLYIFSEAERGVYKYDTITNKSSDKLAPLPPDMTYGGIVYTVGDKIYITTAIQGSGQIDSLYVYDTKTDNFTYLATSSLIPRNDFAANTVIGDKIYFVGGVDPFGNPLNTVVEYDTLTNEFSVIAYLDDALKGAATTSVGGSLYVVGGEKHSEPELTDDIVAIHVDPKETASMLVNNLFPITADYKNRGDYISYVAKKTNEFIKSGFITGEEKGATMAAATKLAATIKK